MQFKPFDYQISCLKAIAQARKVRQQRALIVMASGLGKTVTSAFDAKRWLKKHGGRVLYLCHQNDILEQARQTFEAVLGNKYTYGFFHGHQKTHRGATCVFASFQTMRQARRTFKRSEFSYIIVDESHHGHATTYLPTLKYFTPDFLLGITATPDRHDLRDIRNIYGQEVFSLPLEIALAQGYLPPVDYRLLTDDLQNLDVLDTPIGRLSVGYLNKKLFIPRRDEEIARIIRRHMRKVENPRTMIFCASIKHCEDLSRYLPESVTIHSGLSPTEQRVRLKMFRSGQVRVILTVDKFNEGVDIPDANPIVFLRSTASRTIFFQQLGRGLRRAHGKRNVVVLDFVANCERLQIINDLWERVNSAGKVLAPRDLIPVMTVDTGRAHFTHVAKRVLDILAAIRGGYTREILIHQLRTLAKELKGVPKQVDVARASAQGKCASTAIFGKKFGSFSRALEAAGFPSSPSSRRYTKNAMIKSLRVLAQKLGHTPNQIEVNSGCKRSECPSVNTLSSYFGSFTNALRSAGLKVRRHYDMSREDLLINLRKLAKKLGRTPTISDIHVTSSRSEGPSITLYIKMFGSLNSALLEAGINPTRMLQCTRSELIKQLSALAKKLGRTPTVYDITAANKRGECGSTGVFVDRFGSIPEAQQAAGLIVYRSVETMRTSDATLIRKFKKLAKKLGRTPVTDDMNEASKRDEIPGLSTYRNRFGSLTNLQRLAGIAVRYRNNYTQAEVKRELRKLALKLDRTPTKHDVAVAFQKGTCTITTSACRKLFGSFNAALIAAGIQIAPTQRRYSEEEMLKQLRRLARKLKRSPNNNDVAAASRTGICPSPASIGVKFGSFNNALRSAGLPVTRERKTK